MAISFQFDNVRIGGGTLFLIAGPCVIESEDHAIRMAEIIKGVTRSLNFPFIFKASYDKANRTSLKSFRGPGRKEGLRILRKVKEEVRVPILTDVHEAGDVSTVAEVADILQIPAFLCRQTDLIVSAALSERVVNIKKGQFVSPWDMKHAVDKCHASGNKRVFVTERGSSFGYNNLVVDMRSLSIMRKPPTPCNYLQHPRATKTATPPAVGSRNSFQYFRGRQWLRAWTACSWKSTTIRKKPSPMAPMRSTRASFVAC